MRKCFIAGLIVLLPLLVTYAIVAFGLSIVTSPFEKMFHHILAHLHLFEQGIGIFTREQLIHVLSKIFILCIVFGIIILIGLFGQWVFFDTLGYSVDRLLRKIPIVRRVYGTCKDLVDAVLTKNQKVIRRAVLVPYPSQEQQAIGIATGEYQATFQEKEETFVSVFVPSTPNATVGYLVSFPKSLVTYLERSGEEALKSLLSFKIEKES